MILAHIDAAVRAVIRPIPVLVVQPVITRRPAFRAPAGPYAGQVVAALLAVADWEASLPMIQIRCGNADHEQQGGKFQIIDEIVVSKYADRQSEIENGKQE